MAVGGVISPDSYLLRLGFWGQALADFIKSPLLGSGGQYQIGQYWHSHNLILTTAAERGLSGLLPLAGLAWSVARRWSRLPAWAAAIIAAYGAWSMVDEPLQFAGPGLIFFIALAKTGKE